MERWMARGRRPAGRPEGKGEEVQQPQGGVSLQSVPPDDSPGVCHARRTKVTEDTELGEVEDDDVISETQSPIPQHTLLFSAPQGASQPVGRGLSSSETNYSAYTCLSVFLCGHVCACYECCGSFKTSP